MTALRMKATVKLDQRAIDRLVAVHGGVVKAGQRAVGGAIADEARALVSRQGNGRVSAPGSPPFRQTGQLLASIGVFELATFRGKAARVGAVVYAGSKSFIAHILEGKLQRPFMRTAFVRAESRFPDVAGEAMARAARQGGR